MTARPTRWETDPLFSAAEVVQDSADRMESLFRLLMHEWDLLREDHKLHRTPSFIHFRKRDLVTALETTKWQLEDFERAVHAAADETGSREHGQFISAIRDQVLSVQRALTEISIGDSGRSVRSTAVNEPDAAGLASFLSGYNPRDLPVPDDPQNKIAKKIVDEIIELEGDGATEEAILECSREVDRRTARRGKLSYLSAFMSRFLNLEKFRHSRTFLKRRKDGEITDLPPFAGQCKLEPLSTRRERIRGFSLHAATLAGVLVFGWLIYLVMF